MSRSLKKFLIHNQSLKASAGGVTLDAGETHHLKNVLRLKEGSFCLLHDGEGNEAKAEIKQFLKNGNAVLSVAELVSRKQEVSVPKLIVAQAIPQHAKMDLIAEKASELGVFKLIPLISERTVVRPGGEKAGKVTQRWKRISEQTIKQSKANKAVLIEDITSFSKLCEQMEQFDVVFLLDPSDSEATPIHELDFDKMKKANKILLCIGPEGGFSRKEIGQAKTHGAKILHLHTPVLKTDTAFIAAAGFFQILLGGHGSSSK